MRKFLNLCYLSLTIFIFAFSCSKDDKDEVVAQLEGKYNLSKIEFSTGPVWTDMTVLINECERNIIIEFKDGRISTTDPSNECESQYIYSGTYTVDGDQITSNTLFQGEIVSNSDAELVLKVSFEDKAARATLKRVR
ncbi:lipocalin-like domain-containing protein [Gynurincola endophyticus]|uniref:lipocalin family protein n=1 Tax=Gynurincola endophyticus TaxID=2479004 RepID=UPI000F8E0FE3|nr:lipocalin family protein [Gynurincola endophyticus]